MDLSVIIVNWNVREKLKNNLKALYASQGDFDFEIFVVDNNSHDQSLEMLRNNFPQVKLIANKENLGFARANNQAIKKARGEFVLLLNPDMRVEEDTLFKMINWMRANPQASVAGCCLKNENGENIKHVRRFPGLWDQLAIIWKLPHLFPGVLKRYIIEDFDYAKAQKVDSIRGGFFVARREVFQRFKGLDERYFIWFEEVDFCKQVYQDGGEVWYTPEAMCTDFVGQSFKQVDSMKKQKYFRDSMLKYFKKWHPGWQYALLWIAWWEGLLITWITNLSGIKSKNVT